MFKHTQTMIVVDHFVGLALKRLNEFSKNMKQSGTIGLCRLFACNITAVTLNFLFGVASRNNNGSLKVAQHFYI